jgi:hypothetical protein
MAGRAAAADTLSTGGVGVACLPTRAAVLIVGLQIDALPIAHGASTAWISAGTVNACTFAAADQRTGGVAGTTMIHIAGQVDAAPIARRQRRARIDARAIFADPATAFDDRTRPITRAAVIGIGLRVDAALLANRQGGAGIDTRAVDAFPLVVLHDGTGGAALSAVVDVGLEVDRRGVGGHVQAGLVAFGVDTGGAGPFSTWTPVLTAAAVLQIGQQIDADPSTFEGPWRAAFRGAHAIPTDLGRLACGSALAATSVRPASAVATFGPAGWLGVSAAIRRRAAIDVGINPANDAVQRAIQAPVIIAAARVASRAESNKPDQKQEA